MKICKIQGGLGNQMFQYAATRALETNSKKDIYLDLSFIDSNKTPTETFTPRDFELSIFDNLRAKHLGNNKKSILLSNRIRYKYLRKILRINTSVITQIENELVAIPDNKNTYLNGYFQSEKYFLTIRQELINDFKFPLLDERNEELRIQILSENAVSLHIRRGDYVKSNELLSYHGVLPISYYEKSVKSLLERETEPIYFYVFSDDPDYASSALSFLPNKQIIDWNLGKNSWKDMCLMQACRHHIVANSSFSWWGAWLSSRDGSKFAPRNWFGEKAKYNINDFVPNNWQIIV